MRCHVNVCVCVCVCVWWWLLVFIRIPAFSIPAGTRKAQLQGSPAVKPVALSCPSAVGSHTVLQRHHSAIVSHPSRRHPRREFSLLLHFSCVCVCVCVCVWTYRGGVVFGVVRRALRKRPGDVFARGHVRGRLPTSRPDEAVSNDRRREHHQTTYRLGLALLSLFFLLLAFALLCTSTASGGSWGEGWGGGRREGRGRSKEVPRTTHRYRPIAFKA